MNQVLETATGRELDAKVATLMGLCVVGVTTCTHIEGEWDVSVNWGKESPYASQEPVFIGCDHSVDCERCNAPEDDVYGKFQGYSDACLKVVPRFSSDIASAMQVVEKLHGLGWSIHLNRTETRWSVEMIRPTGNLWRRESAEGELLPEAICRAAILAVENQS